MEIKFIYIFYVFLLVLFLFFLQVLRRYKIKSKENELRKNFNITIKDSTVFLDKDALPKNQISNNLNLESRKTPADLDSDERRRHPRKTIQLFVDFVSRDKLFKETSKNLSDSGMFLKTSTPKKYNVGDFLTIAFQTLKGQPKKYDGKVVRKTDEGIGIQFIHA